MVNLKEENDGFKRHKSSFFQAIGTPTRNVMSDHVEFATNMLSGYDWQGRPPAKPFRNMLLTPVALRKNKGILHYLKDLKKEGIVDNVMFDSGGFQVLTGSLKARGISNLDDLQKHNEELYNEYDWADIYIMPDHPPNLSDVYHDGYKRKINDTIEASLKFYECLKPEIQGKVAPVFHLRKDQDIEPLYDAYKPMLDKSKFASYSASCLTHPGSPRQLRGDALIMLNELQKKMTKKGVNLHCLGISSPGSVFILHYMGIRTYDASTPIIGAGLGKVYFPYIGGISCSLLRDDEDDNMTEQKLKWAREVTNHRCPFCEDLKLLKKESNVEDIPGYLYRRMHNFCMLDQISWTHRDLDVDLFKKLGPAQFKIFQAIYESQQVSFF